MLNTRRRIKRDHVLDKGADPLGPRTCVHGHGAADRTGNTDRELKARKPARQGVVDQTREHHARTNGQRAAVLGNNRALKLTSQRNDGAAITGIGNQQVGPLADNHPRHLLAVKHRHGATQGMVAMARHKEVGLAADTIACMACKTFVLDHVRVDHARKRHDGVKQTHRG